MATPLNRAQMRDAIRRMIEVVPLYDQTGSTGDEGQPTPGQPEPNNNTMNDAIAQSIDYLNRNARIELLSIPSGGVAVSSAPTWLQGPYPVDVSAALSDTLQPVEISEVTWDNGQANTTGQYIRLQPVDYYAEIKPFDQFKTYPQQPTPQQYFVIGNQVFLVPAPNTAGTLWFYYTIGIPQLTADTGTGSEIAVLPVCFQDVILYASVTLLSARQGEDTEAQSRFDKYMALTQDAMQSTIAYRNAYPIYSGNVPQQNTQKMTPFGEYARRYGQAQQTGGG
jgi:hypothetical protein